MNLRYMQQAEMLLEEGATPAQVDKAIRNFGFRVGPFQMSDIAGIDVFHNIRLEREREGKAPKGPRGIGMLPEKLYQRGRLGLKNGKGYYTYAKGSREGKEDPEVLQLLNETSKELGITRRKISDEEIVDRCMCVLVNEGSNCVGEGIARQASDVDIVWIFGFSFPPQKGGPMHWANARGLRLVQQAVQKYRKLHGEEYWPQSALLDRLVAEGKTFGSK
eukprot:NODE_2993_length_1071_cov_7.809198_g2746_i0.p1 GENE.NODE_2993_length_1071_cov_7.809198_g2746_i0~~NODE_2993_length_1071_cov_7.809198_g2746_i0.p1  ORF type:complete len:242 (+),score=48.86 NODE_2993_length_1071_cov_7.809198_g2746_i0:72-728(+)